MAEFALGRGVSTTALAAGFTGTGVVNGTPYALPQIGTARKVSVMIAFGADPGAYVFSLQGSHDGVEWAELPGGAITGTGVADKTAIVECAPQIRLVQTSKANAVTATATLVLL